MNNYGITSQGFRRPSLAEIIEENKTTALSNEFFGPEEDVGDLSPLGIWIQLISRKEDNFWKQLESLYYNCFIDTAVDNSLDYLVGLGGITRNPATSSIVTLLFTGVEDSIIPIGTICRTRQEILFITTEELTIGSGGTVQVSAKAINPGLGGTVAENSIVDIVTPPPQGGIDSVNNPQPSIGGQERETDAELRFRYKTRGTSGGSSVVAIQTLLQDLDGVIIAQGFENDNFYEDEEGRPPNSMEFVIEGGESSKIAEIFEIKKAGGTRLFGDIEFTKVDNSGISRIYRWNQPTPTDIFVKITIITKSNWVNGSESIVKTNLIKLVGGVDTIDTISTEYKGKGIGGSYEEWELKAVQFGSGVYDTDLVNGISSMNILIDTANPPVTNSLELSIRQRPVLTRANIEVVIDP